MAISHVCLSCGLDLARVRAGLDPRYALPIVVCPDCGWAAVRRRPRFRRATLRLLVSLVTLVIQMGLFAGGLIGVTAMSMQFGGVFAEGGFGPLPRNEVILRLVACGLFAVTLGAWLTAGLGHCRQVRTWLVFTGCAAVLLTLAPLFDPWPEWLPERYATLAVFMAVATAGVPIGILARRAALGIERGVKRSLRRRLRAGSVRR